MINLIWALALLTPGLRNTRQNVVNGSSGPSEAKDGATNRRYKARPVDTKAVVIQIRADLCTKMSDDGRGRVQGSAFYFLK